MNYTKILLKKKCKNFQNCRGIENKNHTDEFFHACPFGEFCDKQKNESHINTFVHPCPYGKNCKMVISDKLHKIQFSHDIKKGNSKELDSVDFFYKFRNENFDIQKPEKSIGLPQYVPLPFCDKSTWTIIKNMNRPINGFNDLKYFMGKISGPGKNDYSRLYEAISVFGKRRFYGRGNLLHYMIGLLKDTKRIFHVGKIEKIPFLQQGKNAVVKIPRNKVACLLVNAFFSTFTFYKHGAIKGNWDNNKYLLNVINFKRLFNMPKEKCIVSKILFYMNYFERLRKMKTQIGGNIVIERKGSTPNFEKFKSSNLQMGNVIVKEKGTIESDHYAKQMDFSNMYLGGGVLGHGAVQEEIRFGINPECLISLLLCPCLLDNESVLIYGSEQFSSYKGYGNSLLYGGNYVDKYRSKYEICAIDALRFSRVKKNVQFRNDMINRELWKAYVGFEVGNRHIATGNWGCGAFRGNLEIKFLIQWLAASLAQKKMVYYTFGKRKLSDTTKKFCGFVKENKIQLKVIYNAVLKLEKVIEVAKIDVEKASILEMVSSILVESLKK